MDNPSISTSTSRVSEHETPRETVTIIFAAGVYKGQVNEEGEFHGFGIFKANPPSIAYYIGDWVCGRASGRGIGVRGSSLYEGQMSDNKCCGYGVEVLPGREQYEGGWLNNLRHGRGTLWFLSDPSRGDRYEGGFARGVFDGYGTYWWADGSVRWAHFKDGLLSGHGVTRWTDGSEFEGDYEDDVCNGRGEIRFRDGRVLVAEYLDDERKGPAEMRWPNGDRWVGEFLTHQVSRGIRTFKATGDTLEGVFSDYELKKSEGTVVYRHLRRQDTSGGEVEEQLGVWRDDHFYPTNTTSG